VANGILSLELIAVAKYYLSEALYSLFHYSEIWIKELFILTSLMELVQVHLIIFL